MSASVSHDQLSKTIIDHFDEGVLVLDREFKIVFASNVILELTGYAAEEMLSKSVDVLFYESADSLKFVLESKDPKIGNRLYADVRTKDKKLIPVKITVAKESGGGEQKQFLVYVKDGRRLQQIRKDIIRKAVSIEKLSKSRKIRDGKLTEAVHEILQMASRAVNTERVNVWLFNADHSEIECIGNFDSLENKMVDQENLTRIVMPQYFKLFHTEMIITTSDAFNDPVTKELLEVYLRPNRIHSLMDIPVRIEGEIIGVLCFEHRETHRVWNLQEQKFAMVIAQMISLALETNAKQKATNELLAAVNEQKVLLKEVHHRVKNNLTIISSLLNLQSHKAKDDFHRSLFQESRTRLDSIATVHQLLYQSKSFAHVNFKSYLDEIMNNLHSSFSGENQKISIKKNIKDVELDVSTAIPLALVVNELVTNSYKHAFKKSGVGSIEVSLYETDKKVFLRIKDNGPGYDLNKVSESSIGMDIVHGLLDQINAAMTYDNRSGSTYDISFTKAV